jgi:UMF1 family MFS transporter
MATQTIPAAAVADKSVYQRRIWAWTMYDWANSAFATTILAAVLPIYYSQVAGATLPSAAVATAYWSAGLSISLLIAAIISPILGTISDIMRGKKRFLAVFAGIGILGTALLVFVQTGDWILASILGIIGRIGFNGANVFYDALLPHVAREEDRDRVSARGYAMGYLGGGVLLAINVYMIQAFPDTLGPRLSFLSVAIWWAIFSIPLFLSVPEPPAATARLKVDESVLRVSFKRLAETFQDIRQYKELFKYLVAFLIYVDGIGTIIGVAAIYGAELGFGSLELILALLLVQFVGIPYSLIFGSLPNRGERSKGAVDRRPFFLAFVLFNLIALPLAGIGGARLLPSTITGTPPPRFRETANAAGQGLLPASDSRIFYGGDWEKVNVPAEQLGGETDVDYFISNQPGASYSLTFNGQQVEVGYSAGPDHGIWAIEMDGSPLPDSDSARPLTIDAYNPTTRYGLAETFMAASPGEHTLTVRNTGEKNPAASGAAISLAAIEVLPPLRVSSLGTIIGLIGGVQLLGLLLSLTLGKALFSRMAKIIDTRRSILLALVIYTMIAIWGYFLDSVIEFWFLAWMVAVVQGGSQALSRSLFCAMSPASKSGEFFGLFGVMEKFAGILGPLIFAFAAATFNSSRPAVLSVIAFFIIGGFLLSRVNVDEGRRVAQAEDAALLEGGAVEA